MLSVHCCIVNESKNTKAIQPGDILMSVGNYTLLGALSIRSLKNTSLSIWHTFYHNLLMISVGNFVSLYAYAWLLKAKLTYRANPDAFLTLSSIYLSIYLSNWHHSIIDLPTPLPAADEHQSPGGTEHVKACVKVLGTAPNPRKIRFYRSPSIRVNDAIGMLGADEAMQGMYTNPNHQSPQFLVITLLVSIVIMVFMTLLTIF